MNNLNGARLGVDKQLFYIQSDFKYVMSKIYCCYLGMIEKYPTLENNENKIRNRLYKDFLEPARIKENLGIHNWIFHPETPEINDEYHEHGRTDLKLYLATEYVKNENAYYIIECKRLDGGKFLNESYVKNGIERFISEKYPTHKKVNGMLGFVVKAIDINKNSKYLGLICSHLIPGFQFAYTSEHKTKESKKDFTLYHLMLDFSSKIE